MGSFWCRLAVVVVVVVDVVVVVVVVVVAPSRQWVEGSDLIGGSAF